MPDLIDVRQGDPISIHWYKYPKIEPTSYLGFCHVFPILIYVLSEKNNPNQCRNCKIWSGIGVCIKYGYPYWVLSSFYDSILEHYRAVPPPPSQPNRPAPKFDLRSSLIWYIKTPRLFPSPSLTWTESLYHTCHNNGMILLITTKTLFYWANADENGFLHVFSTGNLLNSRALWQTRACAKERKRAVHMSTKVADQVFFILHRKRCRFHSLLNNFKVCKNA